MPEVNKQKLTFFLSIFAFSMIIAGYVMIARDVNLGSKIEDKLKLKTDKSNILSYLVYDDIDIDISTGEITNRGKAVKYIYKTEKKKDKISMDVKGDKLEEDISKRTKNSITFKINKFGSTDTEEEYYQIFYPIPKFYQDGEDWYEIDVATTTEDAYNEQTATTTADIILDFLGKRALAADSYYAISGDGSVLAYNATYLTARNATSGNLVQVFLQALNAETDTYYVRRTFIPMDISALPNDATVTAASVYLKPSGIDGTDSVALVGTTTQADPTSLVTADFNDCGTVNDPTEIATRIAYSSHSVGTYKEYPLNSFGLASISPTATYFLLGLRASGDISATSPTLNTNNYITFYDSASSGNEPYVSVTYTTGGAAAPQSIHINSSFIGI